MRAITKYVADDKTEFTTESARLAYEDLCERVRRVTAALGNPPDLPGCGFANGDGYLQHDPETVHIVRNALLDIIRERIDHKWVEQTRKPDVHPSWVARLIGDYSIRPMDRAWGRICCIDSQWREWGQPYYANNPHEAKQVRLNAVPA